MNNVFSDWHTHFEYNRICSLAIIRCQNVFGHIPIDLYQRANTHIYIYICMHTLFYDWKQMPSIIEHYHMHFFDPNIYSVAAKSFYSGGVQIYCCYGRSGGGTSNIYVTSISSSLLMCLTRIRTASPAHTASNSASVSGWCTCRRRDQRSAYMWIAFNH